jgi:hypothetical protein
MYNIPVVFLNYTRPKNTCTIASILKEINLEKLYLISDFPQWKTTDELQNKFHKVNSSLKCFEQLDQTEILIKKSTTNKGSYCILEEAIRWAFEQEDFLILLENDTIPCKEFFNFCSIAKSIIGKNDVACGTGFQLANIKREGYTTSPLCLPFWGGILEKNETLYFLDNIKNIHQQFSDCILPFNADINRFFSKVTSHAKDNMSSNNLKSIDMDTYVFMHLLLNNKTAIIPGHNLITYNGFDEESRDPDTNLTLQEQSNLNINAEDMPIKNIYFQDIEFEKNRAFQFRKMQKWIV